MLNTFLTFGDEKAPDASRTRGWWLYGLALLCEEVRHVFQCSSERLQLWRSEYRWLAIDDVAMESLWYPGTWLAEVSPGDIGHGEHVGDFAKLLGKSFAVLWHCTDLTVMSRAECLIIINYTGNYLHRITLFRIFAPVFGRLQSNHYGIERKINFRWRSILRNCGFKRSW